MGTDEDTKITDLRDEGHGSLCLAAPIGPRRREPIDARVVHGYADAATTDFTTTDGRRGDAARADAARERDFTGTDTGTVATDLRVSPRQSDLDGVSGATPYPPGLSHPTQPLPRPFPFLGSRNGSIGQGQGAAAGAGQ
jgi:hypothetical protein